VSINGENNVFNQNKSDSFELEQLERSNRNDVCRHVEPYMQVEDESHD